MKNTLENYRQSCGMTYEQLAAKAGFSSRAVAYLHCSGKRTISAESAVRYSRALNIPLCELRPDLWPPEPPAKEADHAQP